MDRINIKTISQYGKIATDKKKVNFRYVPANILRCFQEQRIKNDCEEFDKKLLR